jgi:hypothetical protein
VRLNVRERRAKQLLRALTREVLGDVDELATAIVASARIAFAYLFVSTDPCASRTALETMFSDAISSICSCWRCNSPLMAAKTSGSA